MLRLTFTWTPASPSPFRRFPPLCAAAAHLLHHRRGRSSPRPRPPRLLPLLSPLLSPRHFLPAAYSVSDRKSRDGDGFEEELWRLLDVLPGFMQSSLASHPDLLHLVEVVMDLGRTPLARFPNGDFVLSPDPVTFDDLCHATSKVGEFAADNRAGISRTLHRVSAIRNRNGVIVGLTCRVGRAVTGSADSLRDLVRNGRSLLLIGPPGVGKTTIIREIARMLADDYKKRVMIVDTSNEIGGDGDIPHPGIGNARRMQVPNFDIQHKVLIEAVENHMPQAIIIDEIGTKLEAMAASTIGQRGIQLVATAHGVTIENLIMNPSLEMLVGGIQSVTLGDEEASRRGVQKTILERKGPSTFTCGVEIISKTELRVHPNLEATVDDLLSGRSPTVKICKINSDGFTSEMVSLQSEAVSNISCHQPSKFVEEDFGAYGELIGSDAYTCKHAEATPDSHGSQTQVPIRLFAYGISETSVLRAIKQMNMNDTIQISDNIDESDAFLALRAKLRKNSQIHSIAKSRKLPVFVTKTTSLEQIANALRVLVTGWTNGIEEPMVLDEMPSSEKTDALEEARLAIEQIVIPKGRYVELLPRPSHILSAQSDLARQYNLKSMKVGKEPDMYIRILPLHGSGDTKISGNLGDAMFENQHHGGCANLDNFQNGGVTRLPLLPE